jgi:hypothetical protein
MLHLALALDRGANIVVGFELNQHLPFMALGETRNDAATMLAHAPNKIVSSNTWIAGTSPTMTAVVHDISRHNG